MNGPPESLRWIRQWVEKAESDLRNAEHTLELDCPLDTVCFHAQQCAEKYLKALLVSWGADFPGRTISASSSSWRQLAPISASRSRRSSR